MSNIDNKSRKEDTTPAAGELSLLGEVPYVATRTTVGECIPNTNNTEKYLLTIEPQNPQKL